MNTIEFEVTIQQLTSGALASADGLVSQHTFSAGEHHLNITDPDRVTGADMVVTVRGGSLEGVARALVIKDALTRAGAATVTLFVPYLPAARQDRGVPFTAKVVADMINLAQFDRVIAVDPHSPVMPSLIDRFTAINVEDVVPAGLIGDGDVSIIAPDAGAHDRAAAVAQRYGLPVVQAEKHRDPAKNYAITGYSCPPVETARAVVIDDICDGGGTFLALADAIDMPRENLTLWTSHGIYAKGAAILSERYGVLACSDSLVSSSRADLVVSLESALLQSLSK